MSLTAMGVMLMCSAGMFNPLFFCKQRWGTHEVSFALSVMGVMSMCLTGLFNPLFFVSNIEGLKRYLSH